MKNSRDNLVYIRHMLDAIHKMNGYLSTHTYEEFITETWDQDAIARNLEIVGEAANNIEPTFTSHYPEIPWRKIINFRNVVAHEYADLDLDIVWTIISETLPELESQLQKILSQQSSQ